MSYHTATRTETPAELVKAFQVEAEVDGQWALVHSEEDNRQRLRTIRFEDLRATALRLTPRSTHGAAQVRIFTMAVNEPAAEEFEAQ
jgi:hypothetical protein